MLNDSTSDYYQTLIDRGGGMICCGDHLGVMIGTNILACPIGWVFIDSDTATVGGIREAVKHQKQGRQSWPRPDVQKTRRRRRGGGI